MFSKIVGALRYKCAGQQVRMGLQKRLREEINPLLKLLGITPAQFMVKQMEDVIILPHVLFIERGDKRREEIRDAVLESGLVPDHRLEHLKESPAATEALALWIKEGRTS